MTIRQYLPAGTSTSRSGDAVVAALILLSGGLLTGSGMILAAHLRTAAVRRQAVGFDASLGVTATTAGLIVVVWWILSFLLAFSSALLERGGRARAAAATGKFSPAFMRRLALAAIGLQLVTAPLARAATVPDVAGPGTPLPAAVAAVAAGWAPLGNTATVGPRNPSPPRPDPRWLPSPVPAPPGALVQPQLRPEHPDAGGRQMTVRAGDSLWSLCAAELGPLASDVDIATAWPELYRTNRSVIGPDPGLLRPGQVLVIPPSLSSSSPSDEGTP